MGKFHLADMDASAKFGGVVPGMNYMTTTMSTQQGGTDHSGSVTLLRPDGTPYPGSPFTGGGLPWPRAAVVDGNDKPPRGLRIFIGVPWSNRKHG